MAKEGSTIGGLMDTVGTLISISLQYGVPLESAGEEIRLPALRAERIHQEPRHPHRQVASPITSSAGSGCQFIPGYREASNPGKGQQELPMKEIQEIEKKNAK